MNLLCIGISYKTAPAEIRKVFAFTQEEKKDFIITAVRHKSIHECVLITTCNRTEVYLTGKENMEDEIIGLLAQKKGFEPEKMKKYFLRYRDEGAVKHLFFVTAGLDSMVIGEDEILGQVKDHYQLALKSETTGFYLNTLFRYAITCAKKIKTRTKLSKTPVSIGTLTANEVLRFSGKDKKTKVLIIGLSGKMGSIIMKNLYQSKRVEITGTSRNHNLKKEMVLHYPDVTVIDYRNRYDKMDETDIVISATSSPHYTVTCDDLKQHLSVLKQRLFIDLAVPCDIDKEVGKLPLTRLIDIDYFRHLAKENNNQKLQEAEAAGIIIDEQAEEFFKEIHFRDFLPYLNEVGDLFRTRPFERILYQIRDNASNSELKVILHSLLKLIENQT
jgi:glutamyl-tRNA reductase